MPPASYTTSAVALHPSRMSRSRPAASAVSAAKKAPGAWLAGSPGIPESWYGRNSTRSTPRSAQASAVSVRRCTARSVVGEPSARRPSSPEVATTATVRNPPSARRAMVPPVKMASSSGWAWKKTTHSSAELIARWSHSRLPAPPWRPGPPVEDEGQDDDSYAELIESCRITDGPSRPGTAVAPVQPGPPSGWGTIRSPYCRRSAPRASRSPTTSAHMAPPSRRALRIDFRGGRATRPRTVAGPTALWPHNGSRDICALHRRRRSIGLATDDSLPCSGPGALRPDAGNRLDQRRAARGQWDRGESTWLCCVRGQIRIDVRQAR
jgi:hypothetical protein